MPNWLRNFFGLQKSHGRHAARRPVAALVATGLFATLALSSTVTAANADVGPNPYAEVLVTKMFDGTGHGTADATYVNSENGFVPGDDSADDGVVASHDIVGYEVTLRIKAGPARTVAVKLTPSELLDWKIGKESFCAPAPGITATLAGDTCELRIARGATAQLT
ncbi:MAG: hypothetical protein GX862_02755, partial [Leucobacter sp.]|nr:hypothetical protein [Leucobacter sp.]